jgi:hypothetical protein
MAEETPSQAHDRGFESGSIAERLAHHDKHFAAINGSIDRGNQELAKIQLTLQSIMDQAKSDAATRITTAAALKEAEDQRRNNDTARWTPLSRALVLLSIIATIITIVFTLYFAFTPK